MNLLAFDTSTEVMSIAVARTMGARMQLWQHTGVGGAQASTTLIGAILDLMLKVKACCEAKLHMIVSSLIAHTSIGALQLNTSGQLEGRCSTDEWKDWTFKTTMREQVTPIDSPKMSCISVNQRHSSNERSSAYCHFWRTSMTKYHGRILADFSA